MIQRVGPLHTARHSVTGTSRAGSARTSHGKRSRLASAMACSVPRESGAGSASRYCDASSISRFRRGPAALPYVFHSAGKNAVRQAQQLSDGSGCTIHAVGAAFRDAEALFWERCRETRDFSLQGLHDPGDCSSAARQFPRAGHRHPKRRGGIPAPAAAAWRRQRQHSIAALMMTVCLQRKALWSILRSPMGPHGHVTEKPRPSSSRSCSMQHAGA